MTGVLVSTVGCPIAFDIRWHGPGAHTPILVGPFLSASR
ncbi:hypothetical protein [Azospirillum doebereinerae]